MRSIVVLGGNAFTSSDQPLTMSGQFTFAEQALGQLKPFFEADTELVVSHGNGPQVGHILRRVEEALGKAYNIPLEVCVAESEGELGYVLEQALYNVLEGLGKRRPIAGLLSQVVVDKDDPAFDEPTKPIGPFHTPEEADQLAAQGLSVREDAGRGYRRVVPSPRPVEILDIELIDKLLSSRAIVIAAGGGGIPVVRRDGRLEGVEAVIDKDRTAALLGVCLKADLLVILTAVPCAFRFYGTRRQSPIGELTCVEARTAIREGHFAEGSMKPKIESVVDFVEQSGGMALICDPDSLHRALKGQAGTIISA